MDKPDVIEITREMLPEDIARVRAEWEAMRRGAALTRVVFVDEYRPWWARLWARMRGR